MKQRDVALSVVLTLITCGIYGIYWFISITDDMNDLTGDHSVSGGMVFLYSLLSCGIYTIYWSYKMGERVGRIPSQGGQTISSNLALVYLVLSIFDLDIIVWALIQSEMNKVLPA